MWFALVGALLIVMAVISAALKRLPLTTAIVYLTIGFLLGDSFLGVISVNFLKEVSLFRLLTEIAVIISLFTAGLKLRLPLKSLEWRVPFLLATSSMLITIFLLTLFAHFVFGFSLGAAILLSAILAPTDPVLASSVQVLGPEDRDRLRFSLTAEAGLNDGIAFPFVMLGLGLLGIRDLGDGGLRWVFVDLLWGVIGGVAIGTLLGDGVGKVVAYLRIKHEETESFDDFLALGLIGLSYGIAVLLHACGFLAVFAAGLALRQRERRESRFLRSMLDRSEGPLRTDTVSGHMALGVLEFNEQMERIGELIIVTLLGALLSIEYLILEYLWFIPMLFLIVRPLSVLLGTGVKKGSHKILLSWFGIRGIGSLYYLAFVIEQGLPDDLAKKISSITFLVVVASILIHGLSSAPLMIRHVRRKSGDITPNKNFRSSN
ncbi:MAG: cation:proton antiporter [Pseudobdellovibrionaceae bacterium]